MFRLLSEAPPRDTAALLLIMLFARMTEGIGVLMLVPLLDNVTGIAAPSPVSNRLSAMFGELGLNLSIGPMLILFVILILLRSLLLFAQQMLSARYQYAVVDRLRQRLFGRLLRAEWRWLADQRASDLTTLLTVTAGRVGVGLGQLIALVAGLSTLIAFGITAFILSWQVACFALAAGLVVYALFSGNRRRAIALGHHVNERNRGLQAHVQEGMAAVRLTKLARAEDRHEQAFADATMGLRIQQFGFIANSALGDMAFQVGGAAMLAVMLYGGLTWLQLPASVLLIMVLIFARLLPAYSATQQAWHYWLHSRAALEEFDAVLAESEAVAEPLSTGTPLPLHRAIEVERLTYAHAGRGKKVLDEVSFRIEANSTVAVSGPSGSGKSSIADLLCGLLQPDGGVIRIDDVQLDAANRLRWRSSIAYVQQDSFLFHDSIIANLRWARPQASMEEISAALRAAAADFVFALPQGLDTIVGDTGQKLSGGERQRIALARALLAKPALLILDEATSALDLESERLVHNALEMLRGCMTIVIIGHRLGGLGIADQHFRLEKGKLHVEVPEREPAPA